MKTEGGVMVSFDVSALVSVTVTPPTGAVVGKVTANGAFWPGARTTFEGSPMMPPLAAAVFVSENLTGATLPVLADTL